MRSDNNSLRGCSHRINRSSPEIPLDFNLGGSSPDEDGDQQPPPGLARRDVRMSTSLLVQLVDDGTVGIVYMF